MKHVQSNDLELFDVWQEDDEMMASVNFPFTPSFPATTGIEADDVTVVYTELEPGDEVGTHTESAEELFVLLQGTAEVSVEDERETLSDGAMALVPADAPHGIRNVGDEPVRFVGVFPDRDVTTEFERPLSPMGERVFRTSD